MSDFAPDEPVEDKKFQVTITISSLGNERRVIRLPELTEEEVQNVLLSLDLRFRTARESNALRFTDVNGVLTFAHLDNVAFVEVHVV